MSLGKVWIGHKLSRRMPLVNWQRLQEIGFYLSTLCEFCFRFGFRFWLRFIFTFLFISYATCNLTAAMCFAVQNQQLIAAVWCKPTFYFCTVCTVSARAKLNNTIHCSYGQLFVLHCGAWLPFWQSMGKGSHLLLKFLQNSKSKFQSKNKGLLGFLLLL